MKREHIGEYVTISTVGEVVKAFSPNALPPNPPLNIRPSLQDVIDQAHMALGRLDGIASILPDTSLFLYMYIRKEAVLSSQIEGTQSSLYDLLLFEMDGAPGVPLDDVREVSNYDRYMKVLSEGMEPLP
jgi:Fic family protein